MGTGNYYLDNNWVCARARVCVCVCGWGGGGWGGGGGVVEMEVLPETLGLGVRPRAFHNLLEISQKGAQKLLKQSRRLFESLLQKKGQNQTFCCPLPLLPDAKV